MEFPLNVLWPWDVQALSKEFSWTKADVSCKFPNTSSHLPLLPSVQTTEEQQLLPSPGNIEVGACGIHVYPMRTHVPGSHALKTVYTPTYSLSKPPDLYREFLSPQARHWNATMRVDAGRSIGETTEGRPRKVEFPSWLCHQQAGMSPRLYTAVFLNLSNAEWKQVLSS